MRVLVVHNRYRSASPSGENAVVDAELVALSELGHEVRGYLRSSDEIDGFGLRQRAGLAVRPVRSGEDVRAVTTLVREWRPDVVHVHNPYPLISTAVLAPAASAGAAIVHTVHNLRHVCMRGTQVRQGMPCTRCPDAGHPGPGVALGCYRDSRPASLVMGAALLAERRRLKLVDRWLALTPRMVEHVASLGVPRERIAVKPNTVPDPGPPTPPGDGLLFVGRMAPEKGVRLLLAAWDRRPDGSRGTLTLVGDGEDAPAARELAARRRDVVVRGTLAPSEVDAELLAARAVVLPSLWEEPFPLVALEALARGRPVLACRAGGLPDIVGDAGWTCPPTVEGLDAALDVAAGPWPDAADLGGVARHRYEREYAHDVVMGRLVAEYEAAVDTARERRRLRD